MISKNGIRICIPGVTRELIKIYNFMFKLIKYNEDEDDFEWAIDDAMAEDFAEALGHFYDILIIFSKVEEDGDEN